MPAIPLPEYATLDAVTQQAAQIRTLVLSGDQGALGMVREFHSGLANAQPDHPEIVAFTEANAQRVVAGLYGFPSWAQLTVHVGLVTSHTRPDPADTDPARLDDRFVALGCVSYNPVDVLARIREANQLLEHRPGLSTMSPAAMATAGNHGALAEALGREPGLVDDPVGPLEWPLLLYCAYSRIENQDPALSTLETARLLLDQGADPNVGFLWRGLVPPFTALTGAIGRGEVDQPRHPQWSELARLLLDQGADPNDGQALYNNGLAGTAFDETEHLRLLLEFGLGQNQSGPWYQRFGSRLTAPTELLYDELEVAAWRGLPNRMKLLVGLGLDLNRGVGRSGRTPTQLAADQGHTEVLEILAG